MISEHRTASVHLAEDAEELPSIFANIYLRHIEAARNEITSETVPFPEPVPIPVHESVTEPHFTPEPETVAEQELVIEPEIIKGQDLVTEPALEPEPTEEKKTNTALLLLSLLFVGIVVFINTRWLLRVISNKPETPQNGYLDIVVFAGDGTITADVSVELDFSIGRNRKIALADLVENTGINIQGIYIALYNSGVAILNRGTCEVSDDKDTILTQRKIAWGEGKRFVLNDEDPVDKARIELTYKKEG
jgi:hypothetical protein